MKVTIVTVCFNSSKTIVDAIDSVNIQSYPHIEHIFVDGLSDDNTVDLIKRFAIRSPLIISEPDNGIYDAMNKGFGLATGDIVCFLNSDDCYMSSDVISTAVDIFKSESVGFVYGDIVMTNSAREVVRYWVTGKQNSSILFMKQIPHPAMFVRSDVLKKLCPTFDISYKLAADLKQQLIIKKSKVNGHYLPKTLVSMALGGESTRNLMAYVNGWFESARAFREVNGGLGFIFATQKLLRKLLYIK